MNLPLHLTSTELFMFLHFRKVNSEIKDFAADKKISTSNKVIKPKKTAFKCSGTSSRNGRLPEMDISPVIDQQIAVLESGAPNENIVQNHLNIALLNVFQYLNGRYRHISVR